MHPHMVTSYIYCFFCGVLGFDSVSRSRSRSHPLRPASPTIFHTELCHTFSFARNFVTHSLSHTIFVTHSVSRATLSHTLFQYLCHTPSFTHNFVTHHLSHTTLSHTLFLTQLCHTLFQTQLCHTLSFTHNFFTHSLYLSFTHHLCHTLSFTHYLCHTRHPPSICVVGVALGDIYLHFAWQAWHLATSALTLCGRRRLGDIHHRFAWQAWLLWWAGPGGALGRGLGAVVARWRRVAGVALGDMHLRFAWQASHLRHWWRAWARLARRWSREDAAAHDVADGERMGRHLQPAATDRFSLGGSILLAQERYGWWSDGLRRVACNAVFAVDSTVLLRAHHLSHNFVTHSLSHTIFVTHSVSRTTLSHTLFHTLSLSRTIFHTQLCHTQLCHKPSFTHNFVAHSLSHTTLSHTIFHTQLCHTPSFTHDFITHNSSHTTLHTQFFNFLILHRLLCFSFLSCPASTFVAHY